MRLFNNLENKTLSDIYWIFQLVYMKVQAHSSLEPQRNTIRTRCLWWIKVRYEFFDHLGSYRNLEPRICHYCINVPEYLEIENLLLCKCGLSFHHNLAKPKILHHLALWLQENSKCSNVSTHSRGGFVPLKNLCF